MNILQISDHRSHSIPANSLCCKLDLSLLNYLTEQHQEASLHCLQTVDLLHSHQSFHSPPSCHLHTTPAAAQQFCHRNVKSVVYLLGFQLPVASFYPSVYPRLENVFSLISFSIHVSHFGLFLIYMYVLGLFSSLMELNRFWKLL